MEDSLHYKLRAAHTKCQNAIVHEITMHSTLRPGEPKILEYLAEHEPCSQKDIADGCDLKPASVTGILARMEKRGLIVRENKDGDRRTLSVSMSDLGKTAMTAVDEAFGAVDRTAITGLSTEENKTLMRLLDKVADNLNDYENQSSSGNKN